MSLILDNVSYIYNPNTSFEKHALSNVSLTIPDGQFIGVIGHTGSGKSTLIQHLNGLLKPSAGNIYYNGKDIGDKEFDRTMLRQKVGLVFQYPEYQLFEATVTRDVMYGPENMGLSKLEAEMRSFKALKDVGLSEEFLDVSPFELSGGQKRRVAIAGVLAMQPEILILDEPVAGLDPKGRREVLELLKHIREERGITVILVSHSMEDVAEYVERLIVMSEGSVVMDDEPKAVFDHAQELEEMGLGVPAVTRLMGRLRAEGFNIPKGVITIDEAVNGLMRK